MAPIGWIARRRRLRRGLWQTRGRRLAFRVPRGRRGRSFPEGLLPWPNNVTENLVTEGGDGSPARWQTVLSEQLGDFSVRGVLKPKFDNDFFGRCQVLESFRTARREFRDRLSD